MNKSLRIIDENNIDKTITKLIWIHLFKEYIKTSIFNYRNRCSRKYVMISKEKNI